MKTKFKIYLSLICVLAMQLDVKGQIIQEVKKSVAYDSFLNQFDRHAGDIYSENSISIYEDFAIIGSRGSDIMHNGSLVTNAGACYILRKVGGNWDYFQKIEANDPIQGANFGNSVSIYNNRIIVGAQNIYGIGSAYIFKFNGTAWVQEQKIISNYPSSGTFFGVSVDINDSYAIVGEPRKGPDGRVHIFKLDPSINTWSNVKRLVNVSSNTGVTNEYFGQSVSIYNDHILVGAPNRLIDGTSILAGGAIVYENTGMDDWSTSVPIALVSGDLEHNDQLGYVVDITDGYAILGAKWEKSTGASSVGNGSGAAYIFERQSNGDWIESNKLTTPQRTGDERFGTSVSISPKYAIVGAENDLYDFCGTQINQTGTAYVYWNDKTPTPRVATSDWRFLQNLVASDAEHSDRFGNSVAVHNEVFIVGAYYETSDEQGNNILTNSGSAYFFETNLVSQNNERIKTSSPFNNAYKILDEEDDDEIDFASTIFKTEDKNVLKSNKNIKVSIANSDNYINLNSIISEHYSTNDLNLSLINSQGQVLYETNLRSNSYDYTIPDMNLPSGMYFISLTANNSVQTEKIIIK